MTTRTDTERQSRLASFHPLSFPIPSLSSHCWFCAMVRNEALPEECHLPGFSKIQSTVSCPFPVSSFFIHVYTSLQLLQLAITCSL